MVARIEAAKYNREQPGELLKNTGSTSERTSVLRGEGIDQIAPIRTPPSGHQVIAIHRRIFAVAAAGDVVEIALVTRSDPNGIESRIEKPHGRFAVGCRLLVHRRGESRPLRSGVAGATVSSAARAVIAAILVGVRFRGDVRDVAQVVDP